MRVDFIVVGSGVAALRAAIELADTGDVLVITKSDLAESNTNYAQGGIAVAMSDGDDPGLHFQDTIDAGDGLCDSEAVRLLVHEGPDAVRQLMEYGARFDRDGSQLSLTREAAHSRRRVLHAGGDSTGREIVRALLNKVRSLASLQLLPFAVFQRLIVSEGHVAGVSFEHESNVEHCIARAVLLATGGVGQVFRETTNPVIATGDGIAAAYRAGAVLRDMEFIQFHPTVLNVQNAPRFLLSESMRGEGAFLINVAGQRFTDELAPRDVVARAIYEEIRKQNGKDVYLDLRHLDLSWTRQRFPGIYRTCLQHGVDITRDAVPIRPAAHYGMGGIRTDLDGRTSLTGLFAAGEVASTGVHGANRLASNSLLEGLVFGQRAAAAMKSERQRNDMVKDEPATHITHNDAQRQELRRTIQGIIWEHAGIVRDQRGMEEGIRRLRDLEESEPIVGEDRNIFEVGRVILQAAIARLESRGGHYRSDYPHHEDTRFRAHSLVRAGEPIRFEPCD